MIQGILGFRQKLILLSKDTIRACSYGKKLSHLARNHFDKLSSEISPSYENTTMKSYLTFIWDEKFSCLQRSRLLIGEISVHVYICLIYERNSVFNTFPLSGKPSHMNRTKLFGESKCFLANWDNVFLNEQPFSSNWSNSNLGDFLTWYNLILLLLDSYWTIIYILFFF